MEGGFLGIDVANLIKTKRTLQDVANYEFGGSNFASAFKKLAADVDEAIFNTLAGESEELALQYSQLNQEYSEFKRLFENKNVISLFEPNNHNYNTIYNSFLKPDNYRALERILGESEEGINLLDRIKKDAAERLLNRGELKPYQSRDLIEILGPEYAPRLEELSEEIERVRNLPKKHSLEPKKGIGKKVPLSQKGVPLKGRGSVPARQKRKAMYDFLKNKSSDQIMRMMDTIDGMKKLGRVLELTPEGKQLFQDLKRYKLDSIITDKFKNSVTDQLRLGTFSNLLKDKSTRALVKEIVGPEAFTRLLKLQKNSARLVETANKFFNASQSGQVASDVATIGTAAIGILTLNPYLIKSGLGGLAAISLASRLFADKKFLKYLEEAVMSKSQPSFLKAAKKIENAIRESGKQTAPVILHEEQ